MVIALPLAIWAARQPLVRRFVPLAPMVVWVTLAIPVRLLTGFNSHWVFPTAMFFGLVQTVAALVGTLIAKVLDRTPGDAAGLRPNPR